MLLTGIDSDELSPSPTSGHAHDPRAAMRHGNPRLTANAYTDSKLLDVVAAPDEPAETALQDAQSRPPTAPVGGRDEWARADSNRRAPVVL